MFAEPKIRGGKEVFWFKCRCCDCGIGTQDYPEMATVFLFWNRRAATATYIIGSSPTERKERREDISEPIVKAIEKQTNDLLAAQWRSEPPTAEGWYVVRDNGRFYVVGIKQYPLNGLHVHRRPGDMQMLVSFIERREKYGNKLEWYKLPYPLMPERREK
jgi:hypothetical protein